APMEEPQTISGRIPTSSRPRSTPICAQPRAEPLPSTRARRRFRTGGIIQLVRRSIPPAPQSVAASPEHQDGEPTDKKHGLQFEAPASAGGEISELATVCQ